MSTIEPDLISIVARHKSAPVIAGGEFEIGFGGSLIRRSFRGRPHYGPTTGLEERHEQLGGDDLIEWASICAAIDEAGTDFVMTELGAGFGRWSVNAALAALRSGRRPRLISVEAEPAHFRMLRQHFLDNGLDPEEHTLIEGAATDVDRPVIFVTGHAKEWWGQAILPTIDYGYGHWPEAEVTEIAGLSLGTILRSVDRVDIVDMDVQGAEADVVLGSLAAITAKVRRLHIGTHNHDVEAKLRSLLSAAGFNCLTDYPCHQTVETSLGATTLEDGVQIWLNPALELPGTSAPAK